VRLASLRVSGDEVLAVVAGNDWLAASEAVPAGARTMAELIAGGPAGLGALRRAATPVVVADRGRPLAGIEMLAPVPRPGKIVAIGRNYREHATEEGVEPPPAPLMFAKWPSAVVGPGAEIRWDPDLTIQVDYEAELAVVIGRGARRIGPEQALDHVLGYTCLNDVSARDLQFGDGQWTRGKSLDTFSPMGPVLVTADEIGDPQDLAITCTVGDERVQEARTSAMYFGIAEIISACSRSFTLEPGDVIATGTPGGVGVFRDPPRFLGDGDRVVVEIEGIGRLENVCRHERVGAARARATQPAEATA